MKNKMHTYKKTQQTATAYANEMKRQAEKKKKNRNASTRTEAKREVKIEPTRKIYIMFELYTFIIFRQ